MTSIQHEITLAIEAYRSGRADVAETMCQQILTTQPGHVDAINLMAAICGRTGRLDDGINWCLKGLALSPDNVPGLEILGDALYVQAQLQGAAEAFRRAANQMPGDGRLQAKLAASLFSCGRFEAALNAYDLAIAGGENTTAIRLERAMTLTRLGHGQGAARAYREVVQDVPNHASAWAMLADQLAALGREDEAETAYHTATRLAPTDAILHYNHALTLEKLGRADAALTALQQSVALKTNFAEAHCALSALLWRLGRFEESATAARRALAIKPDYAKAFNNLGNALKDAGQVQSALEAQQRALALAPQDASVMVNYGLSLQALGQDDRALAMLQQAAVVAPDLPEVRFNLAVAQLARGDFQSGWADYSWRHPYFSGARPSFPMPSWDGKRLRGGRLLVRAEQGVGDEIMFAGQLPVLTSLIGPFVVECDARLLPLFVRSFPQVDFIPRGSEIPEDVVAYAFCGDLPGYLRPDLKASPWAPSAYLQADAGMRQRLRDRYHQDKPLVGLAWRSGNVLSGRSRSIPLEKLVPTLLAVPAKWFSLQYGELDKVAAAATGAIAIDRLVDNWNDLDCFAAQVAAMDLVVTIDNSTAHMAGALGKPTWLLLPFDADWRWGRQGDGTPWYPSLHLLRQRRPGEWGDVLERLAGELAGWVAVDAAPISQGSA